MLKTKTTGDPRISGAFLPTGPPAEDETGLGKIPAPRENPQQLRFLVVEDNGVNRRVAAIQLEHQGHVVRTAIDGGAALAMVAREPFDCVLMDVHMPGIDGLEATRRIRERERQTGEHLPILAMTADSRAERQAQFLAAGMDGSVIKPLDPSATVQTARSAIETIRASVKRAYQITTAGPVLRHTTRTARMPADELHRQHDLVVSAPGIRDVLDRIPQPALVIGSYRQIVYANPAAALLIPQAGRDAVIGRRPGEALGCRHSDETAGGCGTTKFCVTCGAAKALRAGQRHQPASEECRIASKTAGRDRDFRVWAAPLMVGGEWFTLFTIVDISDEKRRQALERLFLHDALNTAGGIQGLAALCHGSIPAERVAMAEMVVKLAGFLIDELRAHQGLAAAEDDELQVSVEELSTMELVADAIEKYRAHEVARGRVLAMADGTADVRIQSDRTLLGRVIGNMTKNALEACPAGGTVTIGCRADGQHAEFFVHNPSVMPRDVQLQLFQRSFSTKGPGRGLGTYSMRLLSERYLGGAVSFSSSAEHGTTFIARYPIGGPTPIAHKEPRP